MYLCRGFADAASQDNICNLPRGVGYEGISQRKQ